jgi:hypothetical protein
VERPEGTGGVCVDIPKRVPRWSNVWNHGGELAELVRSVCRQARRVVQAENANVETVRRSIPHVNGQRQSFR